jgi:apolipoprotein N-acyltransferase
MRVHLRLPVLLAASLGSGLLLWIAAPPVGVAWAAWIALVPAAALSLARPESRAGRAAVPLAVLFYLELLLVPALPFGLARDQWGDPPVPVLVGDSPVLVVAFLVVPLAGLLLYALRFPQPLRLGRPWTVRTALLAVLVPATLWTALDLLRTKFDPGGLWGPLSLSQADAWTARLSALAGPWLLTFLVVAVGYSLALLLVTRRPRLVAAPAALVVALVGVGLALDTGGSGRTVRVAAIQPGYDTAEFDLPVNHYLKRAHRDLERASLDLARDLAPLTREAGRRGAELAVWPEATIWVDPAANPRVRAALGRIAEEARLTLVVPYFLRGPDHGAAVLVLPDGSITAAQPKQRPMWFLGERGDDRPRARPAEAKGLVVGTLLGVDAQDPAAARRLVANGAQIVTSSTHDWPALAEEQLAQARLHAAGLRVPLVRADWRHGSAILAPGGDDLAHAGFEKRRDVLVADVPTAGPATPYERVGDWAGWLAVAALLPIAAAAWRSRRVLGRQGAQRDRPAHALTEPEPAGHPPP